MLTQWLASPPSISSSWVPEAQGHRTSPFALLRGLDISSAVGSKNQVSGLGGGAELLLLSLPPEPTHHLPYLHVIFLERLKLLLGQVCPPVNLQVLLQRGGGNMVTKTKMGAGTPSQITHCSPSVNTHLRLYYIPCAIPRAAGDE